MRKRSKLLTIVFLSSVTMVLSACTDRNTTGKTSGGTSYVGNSGSTSTPVVYDYYAGSREVDSGVDNISLVFDSFFNRLYVSGTQDYEQLQMPDYARDCDDIEISDDDFEMTVSIDTLKKTGYNVRTDLTGIIDRTDRSIHFINELLKEYAEPLYSAQCEGRGLQIYIDDSYHRFDFEKNPDWIVLFLSSSVTHRDVMYLWALMSDKPIGWEQIGYAWYVDTCLNPYNESLAMNALDSEMPYYPICIDKGMNPENMSLGDYRILYDAISRVDFDLGLTYWGSKCESRPVNVEFAFSRKDESEYDENLSAFMAASFLGWLDDNYRFEKVTKFCIGEMTFEEAFEISLEEAFAGWKEYILTNY